MDTYYVMVFRTDIGEIASIRIPYGKKFPNVQTLKDAMDRIIATGIVEMVSGDLSGRERVEVVSTTLEEYELS